MRVSPKISALLAGALMLAAASGAKAQTNFPLKLVMMHRPAGAIQLFAGDGKAHAAYELYLANFSPATIYLDSLTIAGKDAAGASNFSRTITGDAFRKMFSGIGQNSHEPHDPVLKSGEAGIIFVFLDFPSVEKSPTSLSNRVQVTEPKKPAFHQQLTTDPIELGHASPIEIGPPLRGDNWWTPNGPSNDSAHRRAVIALNALVAIPERFAVDWVKLGPDGNSYHGNESKNASYYAYGANLHAVADGRVVSTRDGMPENVPHSARMATTIDLRNIAGNYVIEDLGGGRYAMYAHLIPGSLRVKPGDHVIRGQVIGKLGNSGNSTEPHLHFQISTGPLPLNGEGVPFEIDSFRRVDHQLELQHDRPVKFSVGISREVHDQTFMNEDLADFGSP
jgi:murein DD-endopeptidase MepM/ murein hydrolase activator NlpD